MPEDWTMLSARSQAILRVVAAPLAMGYSPREIARGLGISGPLVSALLDELREELERFYTVGLR
jgi:DNA-binding CsgD family transcriptional regulator